MAGRCFNVPQILAHTRFFRCTRADWKQKTEELVEVWLFFFSSHILLLTCKHRQKSDAMWCPCKKKVSARDVLRNPQGTQFRTEFRSEAPLYYASIMPVITSLDVMCLSQKSPGFGTLYDRLPVPLRKIKCGCYLFPPLLCCLQEKMPRGFIQSLQTAGKAADTAEVDIDKHFLSSDHNFFLSSVKWLIVPSPSNPTSSAFNFSVHFLPQSPTSSFQSVFSPSRLDPLRDDLCCHSLHSLCAFCPYHWSFLSSTSIVWAISDSHPFSCLVLTDPGWQLSISKPSSKHSF